MYRVEFLWSFYVALAWGTGGTGVWLAGHCSFVSLFHGTENGFNCLCKLLIFAGRSQAKHIKTWSCNSAAINLQWSLAEHSVKSCANEGLKSAGTMCSNTSTRLFYSVFKGVLFTLWLEGWFGSIYIFACLVCVGFCLGFGFFVCVPPPFFFSLK